MKSKYMNITSQKNSLLFFILSSILVLAIVVARMPFQTNQSVPLNPPALPEDVENVIKGYHYSETAENLQISLSGDRIIRRGKKVLGLRSNLAKTNFFENLKGTVSGPRKRLSFSAADAEWDADGTHPLLLKKDISVTLNGRSFTGITVARIYFRQGVIEISTDRTERFEFK